MFATGEIAHLGHTLTSEGVKPNERNFWAITEFPIPKSTKELLSFVGLAYIFL